MSEEQPRLAVPVSDRDHILGPPEATVTVVEYGDYECSTCGNAHPLIKRLLQERSGDIRFVFRHFPLSNVHAHASVAAQAAEAADLVQYALRLGLEIYRFQSDMNSDRFRRRVREDSESGALSGVRRTPTLFIHETVLSGKFEYDALLNAVDTARK